MQWIQSTDNCVKCNGWSCQQNKYCIIYWYLYRSVSVTAIISSAQINLGVVQYKHKSVSQLSRCLQLQLDCHYNCIAEKEVNYNWWVISVEQGGTHCCGRWTEKNELTLGPGNSRITSRPDSCHETQGKNTCKWSSRVHIYLCFICVTSVCVLPSCVCILCINSLLVLINMKTI